MDNDTDPVCNLETFDSSALRAADRQAKWGLARSIQLGQQEVVRGAGPVVDSLRGFIDEASRPVQKVRDTLVDQFHAIFSRDIGAAMGVLSAEGAQELDSGVAVYRSMYRMTVGGLASCGASSGRAPRAPGTRCSIGPLCGSSSPDLRSTPGRYSADLWPLWAFGPTNLPFLTKACGHDQTGTASAGPKREATCASQSSEPDSSRAMPAKRMSQPYQPAVSPSYVSRPAKSGSKTRGLEQAPAPGQVDARWASRASASQATRGW